MIFPEANQIWWCRQVLKEKWGLQMLLAEALVTKSEYKTCTVEKVRGFFNRVCYSPLSAATISRLDTNST